jgi:hypothetical protein
MVSGDFSLRQSFVYENKGRPVKRVPINCI